MTTRIKRLFGILLSFALVLSTTAYAEDQTTVPDSWIDDSSEITAIDHVHEFIYSATNATITATCSEDGCALDDGQGSHAVTLTIEAPKLATDGETGQEIGAEATLDGLEDFNAATGQDVTVESIKYVGRDDTAYDQSTTAPTEAGAYTALITLNGVTTSEGEDKSVTASVDYDIEPEGSEEPIVEAEVEAEVALPTVSGTAHAQTFGWRNAEASGTGIILGTTGKAKRLEAMTLKLSRGSISYKVHGQGYGWTGWTADGNMAGTTGQRRRIEAVRIRLSDDLVAEGFSVAYRTHSQTYGWSGWTRDGEIAGTTGLAKRLEAVEVRIIRDDDALPSTSSPAWRDAGLIGSAHVQKVGWQGTSKGYTITLGTTGRGLRVEALKLSRSAGIDFSGNITYRAHVQKVGWQGWTQNGSVAGTTGRSLRVEAVAINLTDELAGQYDIWYRVHVQKLGWMAWAKNGELAGTEGLALRAEAIQVALVREGQGAPSAAGQGVSVPYVGKAEVGYDSSVNGSTWQGMRQGGATSGTVGGSGIDKIRALISKNTGGLSGSLSYSVRTVGGSWSGWASDNGEAGIAGSDAGALRFNLSGEMAKLYSVWYRVHVCGMGWLDWTRDGGVAGSTGTNAAIDAYQVRLVSKNQSGPTAAGSEPSLLVAHYEKTSRNETITKYLRTATQIAADDRHGYSQVNRWGNPDYDCSSLVITCLRSAGLNTGDAERTINMIPNLTAHGWTSMKYTSEANLQRGDILIRPGQHTEFYLGHHMIVGARGSEHHTIHGTPGDQTGWEIEVLEHDYNHQRGWDYVLRLK